MRKMTKEDKALLGTLASALETALQEEDWEVLDELSKSPKIVNLVMKAAIQARYNVQVIHEEITEKGSELVIKGDFGWARLTNSTKIEKGGSCLDDKEKTTLTITRWKS